LLATRLTAFATLLDAILNDFSEQRHKPVGRRSLSPSGGFERAAIGHGQTDQRRGDIDVEAEPVFLLRFKARAGRQKEAWHWDAPKTPSARYQGGRPRSNTSASATEMAPKRYANESSSLPEPHDCVDEKVLSAKLHNSSPAWAAAPPARATQGSFPSCARARRRPGCEWMP
jgi:hypothetical protein